MSNTAKLITNQNGKRIYKIADDAVVIASYPSSRCSRAAWRRLAGFAKYLIF